MMLLFFITQNPHDYFATSHYNSSNAVNMHPVPPYLRTSEIYPRTSAPPKFRRMSYRMTKMNP